jgi:hypothetical protein
MKGLIRLAGLTAAMALSTAGAAQAHPGVYSVDARVAATAARQTITVDATGGTFKPSAGATAVPFDATAGAVTAALQADPAIGFDNIDVTGAAGGPYALTWTGALAGKAVNPLVVDSTGLTGGGHIATVVVSDPGGQPVTFLNNPLGDKMATQRQYVAVSDGFALGYRETNGVAGGGLLNLKTLPGGFRTPNPTSTDPARNMTPEQKIAWTAAHTGIQLHATCTGVTALENPSNIWSTETRSDNDPFYAYIPWQKTSAGFGDNPAAWIPAVKTITAGVAGAPAGGVDLSALNTVADFTAACTALGGVYHPADTSSPVASSMVADAVTTATAPLTAQIASLAADKTAAEAAKADLETALAAAKADVAAAKAEAAAAKAEVARLSGRAGRLTLAKDGPAALDGTRTPVTVTGPAGAPVLVRLVLSQSEAGRLRVKSRLLGSVTQLIGADGTATVNLAVDRKVRAAAHKAAIKRITIDAISGDRFVRIPAGA